MTTPVKSPSKKSQATTIFNAKMVERTQGLYASNKEFRAAVLNAIVTSLEVSTASAATIYNQCKKEVEAAGTATLGRDPKAVKTKSATGKPGRPKNSKNKEKTVVEATAPVDQSTVLAEPASV